MYRVDRNNFYRNTKNSTIYTPKDVSEFLFSVVHGRIDAQKIVFDPCVGKGALLLPFKEAGYKVWGLDIEDQGFPETSIANYIEMRPEGIFVPSLVIANPPFNIDHKTRNVIKDKYSGHPLLPEIWLQKTIELFGKTVPFALFSPYGLRLNQTVRSRRWQKFITGEYPEICSIISLPKDIYENILFHSEILLFNIKGLKPHYYFESATSIHRKNSF